MITRDPTSTDGNLRLCDICGDDADRRLTITMSSNVELSLATIDTSEPADLCPACSDGIRGAIHGFTMNRTHRTDICGFAFGTNICRLESGHDGIHSAHAGVEGVGVSRDPKHEEAGGSDG
jgi:hypothetical protein